MNSHERTASRIQYRVSCFIDNDAGWVCNIRRTECPGKCGDTLAEADFAGLLACARRTAGAPACLSVTGSVRPQLRCKVGALERVCQFVTVKAVRSDRVNHQSRTSLSVGARGLPRVLPQRVRGIAQRTAANPRPRPAWELQRNGALAASRTIYSCCWVITTGCQQGGTQHERSQH
jgi:hypothetical protein